MFLQLTCLLYSTIPMSKSFQLLFFFLFLIPFLANSQDLKDSIIISNLRTRNIAKPAQNFEAHWRSSDGENFLIVFYGWTDITIEHIYGDNQMKLNQSLSPYGFRNIISIGEESREVPLRSYEMGLEEIAHLVFISSSNQYFEPNIISKYIGEVDGEFIVEFNFKNYSIKEHFDSDTKRKTKQIYLVRQATGELVESTDLILEYDYFNGSEFPSRVVFRANSEISKEFKLISLKQTF